MKTQEKYIEFTCPHCGGHKLKRYDRTTYEMDAVIDAATGSVWGENSKEGETETVIKCASCGKEFTKEEIYENVERTAVPQEQPRIVIDYKLYTDGDYRLDNCKKWGATRDDEDVDYVGHVEFTGSNMRHDAVNFLWSMLCENEGLCIGFTHPWLLKEFYNMFEMLEDKIYEFDATHREAYGELSGNQDGTEFSVRLIGNPPESWC